jgi:outer membrane protein assembly factor BamB
VKKRIKLPLLTMALIVLLTSVSFYFGRQRSAYAQSNEDQDTWPMVMHDPQRTGYTQSTAPDTNEVGVKWLYNTTTRGASSPVVANGQVIVSIYDGTVLALNSTSGETLWSYDTGAVTNNVWRCSPAIDSGRVYMGTSDEDSYKDHSLYCLNESTGELLWQYFAGGDVRSSPLAFDSGTRELRFTVTGETGTTGFVEVKVAKSLVGNVADLKVYLDGASLDYSAQSTNDSWVLCFTYAHSTHSVIVNLGAASSPIMWFITVAVVVAVVGACLLLYFRKRKR